MGGITVVTFDDRTLTCAECGTEFVFTSGEQQYYAERGFRNDPKRCEACRVVRRTDMARRREPADAGGAAKANAPQRQMYPAVCAECGQQTEVPFEPRGIRPVYCSNCFTRQRNAQQGRDRQ